MKDLSIDLNIRFCVGEKDYDAVYDKIKEFAQKLTNEITQNYDATCETYLD